MVLLSLNVYHFVFSKIAKILVIEDDDEEEGLSGMG